jgi:dTDP-D-glucose 4,6-dehydratase
LLIARLADKMILIKNVSGPMGVMGRNSDNKLIKEMVGWSPNEDLEYGLKITYNWIQEQIKNHIPDHD